jgi:hypothetical protein
MRKLIFVLAAAGALACTAPANAQTTYWYATPFGLTTGFAPWGYGYWGGGPRYYGAAWGTPAVRAYARPAVRAYATVPRVGVRRVVRRANVLGAYAYAPFVGVTFGPTWVYE